MTVPFDVISLVREAATNDTLRAAAIALWKGTALDLFDPGKDTRVGVRISDCGKCVRELHQQIHSAPMLPQDPVVQLTRFDIGTLYGAWIGCLAAAALKKYAPHLQVELEPQVLYRGVAGHIDLDVRDDMGNGYWVVEFKSTYWSGELSDPLERARYQVLQAATYAKARHAPLFSIVTVGPAVAGRWSKTEKRRVELPKMRQDNYLTEDFTQDVDEEMTRLQTAMQVAVPEGDAIEEWRCRGCRDATCPRNPHYGSGAA
ncbi:MAG TPA: PD-(D/E)XK nuclease family protein [Candidatus Baltobacteraceae bacterium]|jgi:hypothetical protein|nr:PD-(D/E)XK nuclease family protein [Candidatus Baltobacteraceae bacterium]